LHNFSFSHLSLFHVRTHPIYAPCSTKISSKFSNIHLGSHFPRSTLIVLQPFLSFFLRFLSTNNTQSFYACLLLLLASQSTGAPSCLSNVHRGTLQIPCNLIQPPKYFHIIFLLHSYFSFPLSPNKNHDIYIQTRHKFIC